VEENRKLREQIAMMMMDRDKAPSLAVAAPGLVAIAPVPQPQPRPHQAETSDALNTPDHRLSSSSSPAPPPPSSNTSRARSNFLTPSNNALGLIRIATRACVRQHIVDLDYRIHSRLGPGEATKNGCTPSLFVGLRDALTSCVAFVCHGLGGDIENNVVAAAKTAIANHANAKSQPELSPWQHLEQHRPNSDRIGAAIMIGTLHVAVSSLVARGFTPYEVRIAEKLVWKIMMDGKGEEGGGEGKGEGGGEGEGGGQDDRAGASAYARQLQAELQSLTRDPALRKRLLVPETQGCVPEDLVRWMEDARRRSLKSRGKVLRTFKDWGTGRRKQRESPDASISGSTDGVSPASTRTGTGTGGPSAAFAASTKTISHSRFHLTRPKVAVVDIISRGSPMRMNEKYAGSSTTKKKQRKQKRARSRSSGSSGGGSSSGTGDAVSAVPGFVAGGLHHHPNPQQQQRAERSSEKNKKTRTPSTTSGAWNDSLDFLLFTFQCEMGNAWSAIAARMNKVRAQQYGIHEERTDNQVKNRYYSTKRRLSRADATAGTVLERMLLPFAGDSGGPVRRQRQTLIEHLMVRHEWEKKWGRKARALVAASGGSKNNGTTGGDGDDVVLASRARPGAGQEAAAEAGGVTGPRQKKRRVSWAPNVVDGGGGVAAAATSRESLDDAAKQQPEEEVTLPVGLTDIRMMGEGGVVASEAPRVTHFKGEQRISLDV
jgi:hypothetical protein